MKKIIFLLLFVGALSFVGLGKSASALYIDDGGGRAVYPNAPPPNSLKYDPPSTSYPGVNPLAGSDEAYYVVGNSKQYGRDAWVNIYVTLGNSYIITVTNAGAGCQTTPPAGGAAGGPDFNNTTGSSVGPQTMFQIVGGTSISASQYTDGSDGCSVTRTFNYTVLNSGTNSDPLTDAQGNPTSYNGSDRIIHLYAIASGSLVGENGFRIIANASDTGSADAITGYGFRDYSVASGHTWTNQYIFGVLQSCQNRSQSLSATIAFKDLDTGEYDDPNISIVLQQRAWNGSGSDWSPIAGQTITPVAHQDDASLTYTFDAAHRYRLLVKNVGTRNTVFVQMAYGLSALAGRYQLDNNDCGGVACNIGSPVDQSVPQNSSATITINGTSTQGWKSTYYVKRTGPSYKSLPAGQNSQDSVIYVTSYGAPPVTVPYTYTIWDSATNQQVSAGSCTAHVTWTPPNTGIVSCTANPDRTSANPSDTVNITVTVYNNNSTKQLSGEQVRQKPSDSANTGLVWPASGFGNFTNGMQVSHIFSVSRSNTTTVTFSYNIYTGVTSAATPDGSIPSNTPPNALCRTSITWGSPPAGFNITCTQTTIPAMTSTATTTQIIPAGSTYRTNTPPANWSSPPPPASTWYWLTPPPNNPGGTFTYTVTTPITITSTVTSIPYQVRFDSGEVYSSSTPSNPNNAYSFGTFGTMSFLKPHQDYVATLFAQLDSSGGWAQIGQPVPLSNCLTARSDACIGGDSPDAVPGQTVSSTYRITITNNTDRNFDPGFGYNLLAHPDGAGLVGSGSMSKDVGIPTGQNTISATFSFVVKYQGTYWVEFRYGGSTVNNLSDPSSGTSWPGTCGSGSDNATPVSITPSVFPYFQVWNGDAAGGGAFRTTANQCPITYPDYVSPSTASTAGKANSDYYGGIRAMSGDTYKSRADFGAVAMGLIPNPADEGFFVTNNAYFANAGMPSGLGGYQNNNSANHCVEDFFTNTQIDAATTPNLVDLQNDINNCPLDSATNSHRCQFQTSGIFISGTINIPLGYQVTVYVTGDAIIDGNIVYQEPFNPNSRASIPYFAIIAKGNIKLSDNVTRLDGLYVAQPTSSGNDGIFATCTDGDLCTRQLVVNGAVLARHVQLLRAHGSIRITAPDTNGISQNPAEIINFTPSMILGAPMFDPQPIAPTGLYSLPPVF